MMDGSSEANHQRRTSSIVISQAIPVPTVSPGTADIIGFGANGVVILRNSANLKIKAVINNFGYNAGGWRIEKRVRLLGDTTGTGATDVVGIGETGVWISLNNGDNSFQAPSLVLNDFAYANGWRVEKHLRFVADLRITGCVDIVGFGDAGVGWRVDKHLRFLADVTCDGLPDVVGFGEYDVRISRNNGDGTFQPSHPAIRNFCVGAGGWQIDKHPRIVADLTGDGRADLLGFGEMGVHVSLNNGHGVFGPVNMVLTGFAYAQGWRVNRHPRFVADLTGNKCGDIIGFGEAGVWVAYNNGNGTFQPPKLVIKNFGSSAGGWRVDRHPRFVADLTGNGCADIIGFGAAAVWVSYNDGSGSFSPVEKLTDDFGYNGGAWEMDRTVRYIANLYK